jgi:hypothetical protein
MASKLDQGRMREPFRGRTLPPVQGTARGRRAAVIRRSRERYGRLDRLEGAAPAYSFSRITERLGEGLSSTTTG